MNTRSKHFTPIERKVLIKLISIHRNVIEGKESDASSLENKKAAWERVVEDYNDSDEIIHTRTMQQLKKMWTNLKYAHRDVLLKEKQARLATGGRVMGGFCQQDKEKLSEMKRQHDMKVARMTESHLDIVHKMEQQHIREIQKLELRKAKAEAELAEFKLAQATGQL